MATERQTGAPRPRETPAPAEDGYSNDQFEQLSKAGARRYEKLEKMIVSLNERQDDIASDVETNRESLAYNTKKTEEVVELLKPVHDVIVAASTFFAVLAKVGKALAWLGRGVLTVVKWGGIIAGSLTAIWAAFYAATHGGLPPGK